MTTSQDDKHLVLTEEGTSGLKIEILQDRTNYTAWHRDLMIAAEAKGIYSLGTDEEVIFGQT